MNQADDEEFRGAIGTRVFRSRPIRFLKAAHGNAMLVTVREVAAVIAAFLMPPLSVLLVQSPQFPTFTSLWDYKQLLISVILTLMGFLPGKENTAAWTVFLTLSGTFCIRMHCLNIALKEVSPFFRQVFSMPSGWCTKLTWSDTSGVISGALAAAIRHFNTRHSFLWKVLLFTVMLK